MRYPLDVSLPEAVKKPALLSVSGRQGQKNAHNNRSVKMNNEVTRTLKA